MTVRFVVSVVHAEAADFDLIDFVAPDKDGTYGTIQLKTATKGAFVAGQQLDVAFNAPAVTP